MSISQTMQIAQAEMEKEEKDKDTMDSLLEVQAPVSLSNTPVLGRSKVLSSETQGMGFEFLRHA